MKGFPNKLGEKFPILILLFNYSWENFNLEVPPFLALPFIKGWTNPPSYYFKEGLGSLIKKLFNHSWQIRWLPGTIRGFTKRIILNQGNWPFNSYSILSPLFLFYSLSPTL